MNVDVGLEVSRIFSLENPHGRIDVGQVGAGLRKLALV